MCNTIYSILCSDNYLAVIVYQVVLYVYAAESLTEENLANYVLTKFWKSLGNDRFWL